MSSYNHLYNKYILEIFQIIQTTFLISIKLTALISIGIFIFLIRLIVNKYAFKAFKPKTNPFDRIFLSSISLCYFFSFFMLFLTICELLLGDIIINQKQLKILSLLFSLPIIFYFLWYLYILAKGMFQGAFLISSPTYFIKNHKLKITFLVMIFIVCLLTPDLIFGMFYSFVISINYDVPEIESVFKSFYTAFIIHFALPYNDDTLSKAIGIISQDLFLNIIEIIHICINKVIEFIILASIVTNIYSTMSNRTIKRRRIYRRKRI